MCDNVFKTTAQKIDSVLGKYFRKTIVTTTCKECNFEFTVATNWEAVREGEENEKNS
jgi:hypothetical protein